MYIEYSLLYYCNYHYIDKIKDISIMSKQSYIND